MDDFFLRITDKLADFSTIFAFKLIGALLILLIGIKVANLIVKLISKGRGFSKLEISVSRYLLTVIKTVLYLVVYLTAALAVGVPAASIVAVLGSAGLAIGLALQGSLSNLAGSFLIISLKPFKIGDYIEGNGVSGTVTDINLFYTVMITPDNKAVTCPNGPLANGNIINYSSLDTRRQDIVFSLSYDTDTDLVRDIFLNDTSDYELVLKDPEPIVIISKTASDSVNCTLRVWTKNADYWTVYNSLPETLLKSLNYAGIKIPHSQMDIHLRNND